MGWRIWVLAAALVLVPALYLSMFPIERPAAPSEAAPAVGAAEPSSEPPVESDGLVLLELALQRSFGSAHVFPMGGNSLFIQARLEQADGLENACDRVENLVHSHVPERSAYVEWSTVRGKTLECSKIAAREPWGLDLGR